MNRIRLPNFPCGCSATTGAQKTILLGDGSRVCKAHGKIFRIVWEEIRSSNQAPERPPFDARPGGGKGRP